MNSRKTKGIKFCEKIKLIAAAKLLQSCPTLCDPICGSPPGSTVPGILQARTLEWVAISFFNEWKWKAKVKSLSPVRLLATPWTVAYQAPPSVKFSRQEYWSGLPLPTPKLIRKAYSGFWVVFHSVRLLIIWQFDLKRNCDFSLMVNSNNFL